MKDGTQVPTVAYEDFAIAEVPPDNQPGDDKTDVGMVATPLGSAVHHAERKRVATLMVLEQQCIAAEAENAMELREAEALEVVCEMTGDDGKPAYTNDTTRKAAVIRYLAEDALYQGAVRTKVNAERHARQLQAEADYHQDMLRIWQRVLGQDGGER